MNKSGDYSGYRPDESQNKKREHQNCDVFQVVFGRSLVGGKFIPLLVVKFLTVETASMIRITPLWCWFVEVSLMLLVELAHKIFVEMCPSILGCCAVHIHVLKKVEDDNK